ncbi:MAG: PAN domain-containing protein [Smithellaceae bacterium]
MKKKIVVHVLAILAVLCLIVIDAEAKKPEISRHDAHYLDRQVSVNLQWLSSEAIVSVRVAAGKEVKEIKIDPYENKKTRSGYSGEVHVVLQTDPTAFQESIAYTIQVEDEDGQKSNLVTGKVNIPLGALAGKERDQWGKDKLAGTARSGQKDMIDQLRQVATVLAAPPVLADVSVNNPGSCTVTFKTKATHSVGLKEVDFRIFDSSNKLFDSQQILATGKYWEGTSKDFTLGSGNYFVIVQAIDASGSTSPEKKAAFTIKAGCEPTQAQTQPQSQPQTADQPQQPVTTPVTPATTPETPVVTPPVTTPVTPPVVPAVITPGTPQVISITPPPSVTLPEGTELVSQPSLQNGLRSWTIEEWYKPSDGKGEIITDNNGIAFRGTKENSRVGIMQSLNNLDVTTYGKIFLTAQIRTEEQKLDGTGWQGREGPVAVFVSYTDVNGLLHNGLPIMPSESQTNRMFWEGFYHVDPTGSSHNWHGTKIGKGQWYTYQYDLMTLSPRPKILHFVGAEGAGWPTREGRIALLSLRGQRTVAPPVTQQTLPSVTDPIIYANGNIGGVQNNPTRETTFTIDSSYRVTFIYTYHYFNSGKLPGTIALRHSDGTVYGPWQTAGALGQGGVQNAYWFVKPNVEIKAGSYTVIDSDKATWSQNSGSAGAGFVEMRGIKTQAPVTQQTLPSVTDPIIYANGNIGGVQNNPTRETTFTIDSSYRITFIYTYHYFNSGKLPGTIALRHSDGTVYGPWQTAGALGQGGVLNAYWFVKPNVEIKAGSYTVIDSDKATWSQNSGSAGAGFVEMRGIKTQAPVVVPPLGPGMEVDIDRPGLDYRSFDLTAPDPNLCQAACTNEATCKAFTYVRPGVQGPNARCWLKSSVPNQVKSTCCVSGVKPAAPVTQQNLPSVTDPIIYANGNIGGVQNNPTRETTFTINSSYRVTFIYTYHYFNSGKLPGTIALRHSDGTVYGPWQTAGALGQGGVQNAYWFVKPNVEIKAGSYTVIDSDKATWSQNSGSAGAGFVEMRGIKIQPAIVVGQKELLTNTALKGLTGWTIQEWMQPSSRRGEVTDGSDGIRFRSESGNTRMGIMQTINADVSGAQKLTLTAVVKAVEQRLDGTGWQGREAPVAVFVTYADVNGVVRNGLGSMANPVESQANRMFWHGFYYLNPTGNSQTWNGTKVGQGSWYTYEVDLMSLSPKPKTILAVGAEGSGWSTREGKISSLSLKYYGVLPADK